MGLHFSNKIGVWIFLSKIKIHVHKSILTFFPDFRLLLFTSWAVALAWASRLVAVEVKTPIPKRGPALVQLSSSIRFDSQIVQGIISVIKQWIFISYSLFKQCTPSIWTRVEPLLQQAAGVLVSQVNFVAVQSFAQTKGLTATALVNYC